MAYNDDGSVEPLSLATFDPVYAREPYLNTPRSLKACKFHGINPEELVEIPFREFQRAYPDDPETALRRFERVDGARKRVLDEVVRKWKDICHEEKKQSRKAGKRNGTPTKETVLKLDNAEHVTVLEMQAEQFRRVEKQQWRSLQACLFMEMKKAITDQAAKEIVEKQDGREAENKRLRRQHELEVEAKHRREREAALEREREQMEENKRAQNKYLEEVFAKAEEDKINERRQRAANMRREMQKLHREEMRTKQKEDNFQRHQEEANERSRQLLRREKEIADRIQFEKKKADDEARARRERDAEKLQAAKEELAAMEMERTQALAKKISDFDRKWHDKRVEKARQHKEMLETKGDSFAEKIRSIRGASEAVTNDKINRTLSELEQKEEAARLELERAEAQRERRRQIKEVRQEAYNLAAARRKKAEEFRKKSMEESIRRKNERYAIIKTGQQTLRKLTDSMEEVVSKTRAELKAEVQRLNSKDMLTADNVLARVKKHSDTVLFPRLENRFGGDGGEDDEGSDEGDYLAQTAPGNLEKGRASTRPNTTASMKSRNGDAMGRAQTATGNVRTLPLKIFSKENLEDSLNILKTNVVRRDMRSPSPSGSPTKISPNSKRSSRIASKKVSERKEYMESRENDEDEWFCVDDEDDAGRQRFDETDEAQRAVERFDSRSPGGSESMPSRQLNRQHTPMPGKIEQTLSNKKTDFLQKNQSVSEEEEDEETKRNYDQRLHSFQSSRKDTPFPEDISRAVAASGCPTEGFIEEDENEEFNDLDRPEQDATHRHRLASSQSAPGRSQESFNVSTEDNSLNRPSTQSGRNSRLRPITPDGSFRREYSKDHPLNGGKGKYSKEKGQGKKEILPKDYGTGGKKKKYERVSEVVSKQEQKKMDLQRKLEALRRHQNEALLEVLEEERKAEELRNNMGRSVSDPNERNRLELVFAEERKRASERIVSMTKDHEKKMKDVILAMDLGS